MADLDIANGTSNFSAAPQPGRSFYFHRRAVDLLSHVGAPDADGSRLSTGQSGYLVFGPYIELPPGRYRAGFELQKIARFRFDDKILLDAVHREQAVLATRAISDDDLSTGIPALLTLDFELERTTANIEIRLLCEGRPQIRVSWLTIFSC